MQGASVVQALEGERESAKVSRAGQRIDCNSLAAGDIARRSGLYKRFHATENENAVQSVTERHASLQVLQVICAPYVNGAVTTLLRCLVGVAQTELGRHFSSRFSTAVSR
jgi:hypothetical protein